MVSHAARATRIQQRAERAVAYWIERLADDGVSFVGSEDEERFLPLSALLADLLKRGTLPKGAPAELDKVLDRAECVADQFEAYGMGTEGVRVRARGAHEDMMARREEDGAPLDAFLPSFERLMSLLHTIDTGRVDDLGAALLEARRLLLEIEAMALRG